MRKDNERFISPQAQLVGAEFKIIEIRKKVSKLNREVELQAFTQTLMKAIRRL